jgi:hypothetical protein
MPIRDHSHHVHQLQHSLSGPTNHHQSLQHIFRGESRRRVVMVVEWKRESGAGLQVRARGTGRRFLRKASASDREKKASGCQLILDGARHDHGRSSRVVPAVATIAPLLLF